MKKPETNPYETALEITFYFAFHPIHDFPNRGSLFLSRISYSRMKNPETKSSGPL